MHGYPEFQRGLLITRPRVRVMVTGRRSSAGPLLPEGNREGVGARA
jgi:hypothetical protein